MRLKLFGFEVEIRRETTAERLERVIRERRAKEEVAAILSLADLRRHGGE